MEENNLGQTRVIANWQPSKYNEEVIREEFQELITGILGPFHSRLFVVFCPVLEESAQRYRKSEFHKDTGGHMIVWSSTYPTLVKLATGESLFTRNGDVILINDDVDEHCRPQTQGVRWFARYNGVELGNS